LLPSGTDSGATSFLKESSIEFDSVDFPQAKRQLCAVGQSTEDDDFANGEIGFPVEARDNFVACAL
jgi:hypothetical protein